jgi:hypothetical protein
MLISVAKVAELPPVASDSSANALGLPHVPFAVAFTIQAVDACAFGQHLLMAKGKQPNKIKRPY